MDYVGARLGQSSKASLEAGEVIVTEVYTNILLRFETKKAMEECIAALKFWENEQYSRKKYNFNKFELSMCQKLSTVHDVSFSTCEFSLRSRLETEPGHQDMINIRRYCAMKLCQMIRKNCNGSSCVVTDDVIGSILETMCSIMMIRGDEHDTLSKYLEATENR